MDGLQCSEPRHLVESSLWKEDVFVQGHRSAWGSWYNPQTHQWGYACCRSSNRSCSCSSSVPGAHGEDGAGRGAEGDRDEEDDDSAADSDATDSEEAQRLSAEKPFDWSGPPAELLPPEAVEAEDRKPGAFVRHFVHFVVGAWRRLLESGEMPGHAGEDSKDSLRSTQSLQEAEAALEPLMRQLGSGAVSSTVIQQLGKMVSLAAKREYTEAGKAYMEMVLGNKKWNNTLASYGGTSGTNKGARIYITKQDDLLEYDKDPVVQKYMQCLRRLVFVAQCLQPNPDSSKHLSI